jgi:uncharacterized protein YndB with AHSA1/START domain
MPKPIQHTILLRADAQRIYRALTDRDDVAAWWGITIDPESASPDLWAGKDRDEPVTIAGADPDRSLTLALRQAHPTDESVAVDARITFTIEPHAGHSLVTVSHIGVPEGAWRELVSEGWVEVLTYLQAWVESGRSAARLNDPAQFSTVEHEITVPADLGRSWRAITDAGQMASWYSGSETAQVRCEPGIGGAIDILWSGGAHVGGEVVLATAPTDWVVHWWDQDSLERRDDPGMITVQRWHLAPSPDGGTTIRLVESGYDRQVVTDDWMQQIGQGWDEFFTNLRTVLHPRTGEPT